MNAAGLDTALEPGQLEQGIYLTLAKDKVRHHLAGRRTVFVPMARSPTKEPRI